jgi:broad specificity phosphatase PhoE
VCSPLGRATETAELIRDELGIENAVEIDERLAGHDMGDATGIPKRALSAREMVDLYGAEDPDAFDSRVFAASMISARGRPTVWSFRTRASPGSSSPGGQVLPPPSSAKPALSLMGS